jgi:uncharacterized protein YecT (DUF1311 family)
MRFWAVALAWLALGAAARAEDAPQPRVIGADRFQPNLREAPPKPSAPMKGEPAQAEPPKAAIVMPTFEHPVGACEPAGHDWLACLEATAKLSDTAVDDEATNLIDSFEHRAGLEFFSRVEAKKALKSAQQSWQALRDIECGDLAKIERGLIGAYREARLQCRIRRNLERVDMLTARYAEGP